MWSKNNKRENSLSTSDTLSAPHFVYADKILNDFWVFMSLGQNPIFQHQTSFGYNRVDDDRYEIQN